MTDIEKELLQSRNELFTYALRLTKEYNRADDLLQETNLKVLVSCGKYIEGTCFVAWAKKIMLNSFLNSSVRECRMMFVEDYGSVRSDVNYMPFRGVVSASETRDIYRAVDRLPGGNARLMRLLITGHKYSEIAVLLDLPLGTVKSRIHLSRAILREELKDYFE